LASLLLFSPNRRNWLREVGRLTQIERRMSIENLQPAEQQHGHADDPDPMGQSDHGRVPIYDHRPFHGVGHDCSQLIAVIVVLLLIPATAVVGSAGSRSCDRLALFFIAADISSHDPSL
jgi:hypothetical protein